MSRTDMTQTITVREGPANVFVAVEHANLEVVGIHASRSANRFEALEPVGQGVHQCFGAIAPGVALRCDMTTVIFRAAATGLLFRDNSIAKEASDAKAD